jgi:hypothetical protein
MNYLAINQSFNQGFYSELFAFDATGVRNLPLRFTYFSKFFLPGYEMQAFQIPISPQ